MTIMSFCSRSDSQQIKMQNETPVFPPFFASVFLLFFSASKNSTMLPQHWSSPCGNYCTNKYAAMMQIPWRIFCKKGCDSDGETWEECLEECDELCYKDPVLKDHQWSAYIDRSPGSPNYSAECFHACLAGCGYKMGIPSEIVQGVHPSRREKPCVEPKPLPPPIEKRNILPDYPEDMPSTSA